jgi:hypothetical protein
MSYFADQYKQLCPGVWVWENFLSAEELIPIMEEINTKDWNATNHIFGFESYNKYKQRIIDSLNSPDIEIPDLNSCIIRKIGAGMEPHVDIQNHANPLYYNIVDKDSDIPKVKTKFARFGAIIYFNDDYEGGEIEYPQENFAYKPKAGSLVLHYATSVHAVLKVISGKRYTHSTYITDADWVEKKAYDSIIWPEKFTVTNPGCWYSYSHGPSQNPALAEFQKKPIEIDKYWRYHPE